MRVAVVGAGGVGGYVGALLARAGHEVVLMARGAHADAIRERGLRIVGDSETFIARASCPAPGDAVAPATLVVLAVKSYDLEAAVPTARSLCDEHGTVLTLVNGVDAAEALARVVPAGQLIVGQITIGAWREAPGVVHQHGARRRIAMGGWTAGDSPVARACGDVLADAGFDIEIVADAPSLVWTKLVWAASYGAVSALARAAAGEVRSSPGLHAMLRAMLVEGVRVGQALGLAVPETTVDDWLAVLARLDAGGKTSMLRDAERSGRLELDALSGAIVLRGARVGVPTPLHALACDLLGPAHQRALAAGRFTLVSEAPAT